MTFRSLLDPKRKAAVLEAARKGDMEFFRKKTGSPEQAQRTDLSPQEQMKRNIELSKAIREGNEAEVHRLILNHYDVNGRDNIHFTPFMSAADIGNLNIIEMLYIRGVTVDEKTPDGWTALMIAVNSGHCAVVECLLMIKADPNIKDNSGESVLDIAKRNGNKDIIKLLKAYGATE